MQNRYASTHRAHVAAGLASVLVVLLGGTAVAAPVGVEFQISTSANEEKGADVGVAADSSFVIVWEDKDAQDILAGRYDAFGNPLGAVFQVSTSSNEQKKVRVAVVADGSFVIVWEDKDAQDILARRYDAFGNPLGGVFQVSTSANEQKGADVGVAADGSFVVVWEDKDAFDILARRYDAFGNPLGTVFQISTSTNEEKGAGVAVAADGRFVIVWEDKDAQDVLARRYDAFGNPLGAVFQVSTSANEQKEADVAVAADGSFVIVWEDKTATEVMAREYSASGSPLGGAFVVNTTVLGDQKKPGISMNADGNYVVVWEDKNSQDIYGWRYADFHHWAFDEGSGSTAADSSASANDATLLGGATWTSDCAGTSAIEFDGLGAYAITAQSISPLSTGTIAFWMRGSGTPSVRQRLFGVNGNWEVRQETNGMLSFDLGASPFVGNEPFSTLSAVDEKDRWYHIVAVFDDTDDSFSVYVDGKLRTSGTSPVDLVPQPAGLLSFGTRTGSFEYWEGALRDFRIYGTKLSAEEVAELYGIIAHWKLDETSGAVAVDSSGRGNDATYVGSLTLGVSGAFPPKTGTAVDLDGSSGYITASASLFNNLNEFSLAGWVRPNSTTPDKSFFGQNGLIELGIDYQTNQIDLWTSSGGSLSISFQFSIGKWTHVAAVGNGTQLMLYVNGVEIGSGGSATTNYGSNSNLFKIGEGVLDASGGYFDGRVDDVHVYSRAMCPEEINAVYKGGRPTGVRILQWLETR